MNKSIGRKNSGKWLEKQLAVTHKAYAESGVAKIEKVEPPIVMSGNGRFVPLRNPFLDFIGSSKGRTVCIEAKSTAYPRLSLLSENGITERQWAALVDWEKHGAMCGVVWGFEHDQELRFISMATMKEQLAQDIKSVPWNLAEKISQGMGFVLNDWLLNLRDSYGYPASEPLTVK